MQTHAQAPRGAYARFVFVSGRRSKLNRAFFMMMMTMMMLIIVLKLIITNFFLLLYSLFFITMQFHLAHASHTLLIGRKRTNI